MKAIRRPANFILVSLLIGGITFASLCEAENNSANLSGRRIVHVVVALCDNQYQGILPVPQSIGKWCRRSWKNVEI